MWWAHIHTIYVYNYTRTYRVFASHIITIINYNAIILCLYIFYISSFIIIFIFLKSEFRIVLISYNYIIYFHGVWILNLNEWKNEKTTRLYYYFVKRYNVIKY